MEGARSSGVEIGNTRLVLVLVVLSMVPGLGLGVG
jgi:hypothetical protein